MFTPDSKAFWWPILHGIVAGAVLFLIGWNWIDIPFGIVFGCLGGFLVWVWQRLLWDGIMRIYYTPVWRREEEQPSEEEQPTGEPPEYSVGDEYGREWFTPPVTDLQLYRFALGIANNANTTYQRWCLDENAPFNSDQYHALREWLKSRGDAIPLQNGEVAITEKGLAFLTKIATRGIQSPTPDVSPTRVNSLQFTR